MYDFDLFVIGAGSGGVRAARFSADFGAKVAVAESRYLGGTCVNVGCVPKKLLVYAASYAEDFSQAKGYGWEVDNACFDWATLVAHKDREIHRLNNVYKKLLTDSRVTLLQDHAQIVNANSIKVGDKIYTTKYILIATGGWPYVPTFQGSEYVTTSNEVFYLPKLPKRVLVVGGSYIAVEFSSIFNGCGAKTSLLYRGELFMRGFDNSLRNQLRDEMRQKGIDLQFNTEIASIEKDANGTLRATLNDGSILEADCVLYATGRRPMLDNLGLENVNLTQNEKGYLVVNEHYQTSTPSVLAIGDVIGRVQLTPVALAEGMAVARQLFKPEQYRPVDYQMIPTAVFSLPNLATVGLTEQEARKQGLPIHIYESRFRAMKLTLTDTHERSLMKLIVNAETDQVLGCHMLGANAAEIMQGFVVALKAGATKQIFDETIGIHPSAAEEFVTMRTPTYTG